MLEILLDSLGKLRNVGKSDWEDMKWYPQKIQEI